MFLGEPMDAYMSTSTLYKLTSGRIGLISMPWQMIFYRRLVLVLLSVLAVLMIKPSAVTFAFGKRQVTVSVHSFGYTWIRSLDHN